MGVFKSLFLDINEMFINKIMWCLGFTLAKSRAVGVGREEGEIGLAML